MENKKAILNIKRDIENLTTETLQAVFFKDGKTADASTLEKIRKSFSDFSSFSLAKNNFIYSHWFDAAKGFLSYAHSNDGYNGYRDVLLESSDKGVYDDVVFSHFNKPPVNVFSALSLLTDAEKGTEHALASVESFLFKEIEHLYNVKEESEIYNGKVNFADSALPVFLRLSSYADSQKDTFLGGYISHELNKNDTGSTVNLSLLEEYLNRLSHDSVLPFYDFCVSEFSKKGFLHTPLKVKPDSVESIILPDGVSPELQDLLAEVLLREKRGKLQNGFPFVFVPENTDIASDFPKLTEELAISSRFAELSVFNYLKSEESDRSFNVENAVNLVSLYADIFADPLLKKYAQSENVDFSLLSSYFFNTYSDAKEVLSANDFGDALSSIHPETFSQFIASKNHLTTDNEVLLKDIISGVKEEKELFDLFGYSFVPVDLDKAVTCANSLDWENYEDFPIEGVLYSKLSYFQDSLDGKSAYSIGKGDDSIKEHSLDFLYDTMSLYAESMDDHSMLSYFEYTKASSNSNSLSFLRSLDYPLLTEHFSSLSIAAQEKQKGVDASSFTLLDTCKRLEERSIAIPSFMQDKIECNTGDYLPEYITSDNVHLHYPEMNGKIKDQFFDTNMGKLPLDKEVSVFMNIYPFLSEQRKNMQSDILDYIFQGRAEVVAINLGFGRDELSEWHKHTSFEENRSGTNIIGMHAFSVNDELKPIGEYLEEIKKSSDYKVYQESLKLKNNPFYVISIEKENGIPLKAVIGDNRALPTPSDMDVVPTAYSPYSPSTVYFNLKSQKWTGSDSQIKAIENYLSKEYSATVKNSVSAKKLR